MDELINQPQSVVVELDYENNKSEPNGETNVSRTPANYNPNNEVTINDTQEKAPEKIESEKIESEKRPSKRWDKEKRHREDKYLLTQALAEEKQKNIELQQYLARSLDNNTISYANQAMTDLENAEKAYAKALESNDALAASKASTALMQATIAVERATNRQMYSSDQEKQKQHKINPTSVAAEYTLTDWLTDNPELDEDSTSFDKGLAVAVAPLINKLDAQLKKRGQDDLISTPQYFDIVDNIVNNFKARQRSERPKTGHVNARNLNRQYSQPSKVSLNPQQKMIAAGLNMSEEQYMSWLNKYAQEKDNYGN